MANEDLFDFEACHSLFENFISNPNENEDISKFQSIFEDAVGSEAEKKGVTDHTLRELLRTYIESGTGVNGNDTEEIDVTGKDETMDTSKEIKNGRLLACESLLEFSISSAKRGLCTSSLPILLLCDTMDTLTLTSCEQLFDFVESNVAIWTSEPFFSAGKNHLLRMCNDILRRLSKLQNTIFCGKIQLFLARLFPLEEKSALNLVSHFNLENTTSYRQNKEINGHQNNEMEIKHEEEEGEVTTSHPVDFPLYKKLWGLQDFFRNPVQCYTKPGWELFNDCVDEVLRVLASHRLEHIKRRRKSMESAEKVSLTDIIRDTNENQYFPKYLTNENLMDLQLNDGNFRSQILLQLLIIFQYLKGNVKFKQAAHVLSESQIQWVSQSQTEVYRLLKQIPPDGENLCDIIKHVLWRDENWINWKNEGCPSFASFPIENQDEVPAKRTRKLSIGEDLLHGSNKLYNLGNRELTRLWNICPDNLEACKLENRKKFLPSLDEFFKDAIEQADPEAGIEEEYKLVNNSNFCWRALRLLARRSNYFFTQSTQPFKALPEYLSNVVAQLAKGMPNKVEDTGASSDTNEKA